MGYKIKTLAIILLFMLFAANICNANDQKEPLKVSELMTGIVEYEKKEVSLIGTVAGACNSGCKIWLSDDKYSKGDPIALVWAKDKAFTFKTNVTGQKVLLTGYAVGKYIDLCAIEKEKKTDDKQTGKDCNPIIETETGKKQLSSITFFATSVDYL